MADYRATCGGIDESPCVRAWPASAKLNGGPLCDETYPTFIFTMLDTVTKITLFWHYIMLVRTLAPGVGDGGGVWTLTWTTASWGQHDAQCSTEEPCNSVCVWRNFHFTYETENSVYWPMLRVVVVLFIFSFAATRCYPPTTLVSFTNRAYNSPNNLFYSCPVVVTIAKWSLTKCISTSRDRYCAAMICRISATWHLRVSVLCKCVFTVPTTSQRLTSPGATRFTASTVTPQGINYEICLLCSRLVIWRYFLWFLSILSCFMSQQCSVCALR